MAIPLFQGDGNLPAGIHWADWDEIERVFGVTDHRIRLLSGFRKGIEILRSAGCKVVYLDGSFVTSKKKPGDFDACWEMSGVDATMLDPVFLDFSNHRAAQKTRFFGEFFPADFREGVSGRTFVEFFQIDKNNGDPKGIIAVDLRRLT